MKKYGVKIKGILKCDDDFLLVKKWYDDRIEEPYQWEFLDTSLADGETPETSCLRYIQESTGILANITSMPYTWVYRLGDNQYLGLAFICEVPDELVILSEDLYDYKWVKAYELPRYIQNGNMLEDLRRAGVIEEPGQAPA